MKNKYGQMVCKCLPYTSAKEGTFEAIVMCHYIQGRLVETCQKNMFSEDTEWELKVCSQMAKDLGAVVKKYYKIVTENE